LQTLVVIALQSLRGSNSCAEYFSIEQPTDGIAAVESAEVSKLDLDPDK